MLVQTFTIKNEERDSLSGTLNWLNKEYSLLCQSQAAALGQEGKPRAANTRVTVPQPQLHHTPGPQVGPEVTPGNSRGALRMKKVPVSTFFQ